MIFDSVSGSAKTERPFIEQKDIMITKSSSSMRPRSYTVYTIWLCSHRRVLVLFGFVLVAWSAFSDKLFPVGSTHNITNSTASKFTNENDESLHVEQIKLQPKQDSTKSNLQDFHRCIDPQIHLPFRQKGKGETINTVYYQCHGTAYDEFADRMEEYIADVATTKPNWGRRPFPFPDNTKILMVGNSHTRQTYQALLCQYQSRIDQADMLDQWTSSFHFQNNVTLVVMANTPYVYSKEWRQNMESITGLPLSSFDAVVYGLFNKYDPASKTTFLFQMLNYSNYIPNVDFEHIPAPSIAKMAHSYTSGSLIALGMFSPVRDKALARQTARVVDAFHSSETIKPKMGHPSLLFVSGRTHVNAIGYEGGSTNRLHVDECDNQGKELHRCAGPRGGHPDVLAWDVIEAIYENIAFPK